MGPSSRLLDDESRPQTMTKIPKRIPAGIRAARVEALKRAVNEGRYHIDSSAIADRMLEEARDIVRARLARR
jgi:flagellar biosynthesis anti-sigma factor FlgM